MKINNNYLMVDRDNIIVYSPETSIININGNDTFKLSNVLYAKQNGNIIHGSTCNNFSFAYIINGRNCKILDFFNSHGKFYKIKFGSRNSLLLRQNTILRLKITDHKYYTVDIFQDNAGDISSIKCAFQIGYKEYRKLLKYAQTVGIYIAFDENDRYYNKYRDKMEKLFPETILLGELRKDSYL